MVTFQVPSKQIQTYYIHLLANSFYNCLHTKFLLKQIYMHGFFLSYQWVATNFRPWHFFAILLMRLHSLLGFRKILFFYKMREIYVKMYVWKFDNMTSDGSLVYSQDEPTSCLLGLNTYHIIIGKQKKNAPNGRM